MAHTEAIDRIIDGLRSEGVPERYCMRLSATLHRAYQAADRARNDRLAAELLPLGYQVACERMGRSVSGVYKAAHRGKIFSTLSEKRRNQRD